MSASGVVVRTSAEADSKEAGPPRWQLDLERAHDQLRHAARLLENGAQPVVDLRPAARALEHAFVGIYDAFDERRPRLHATRAAIASLDEAHAALAPAAGMDAAIGFSLDYLREARKSLLDADERLTPLVPRPPAPAPDLRASVDLPGLHALDRPSLAPLVRVPEPPPPEVEETPPPAIPRPQTFEELQRAIDELHQRAEARKKQREEKRKKALPRGDAPEEPAPDEPPPGFAADLPRIVTPAQLVKARVRECFEEVAMIGMQRAPLLGDPWRTSLVLEHRMLAAMDAIVAMGPGAVAEVEPLALDAPAKDPSRVFGVAMTLGCLTGRDALAAAERVFLAYELGDPANAESFAGALKLVPHPSLPLVLRTWLADADPAHRAIAVDVLGYRGLATVDELARAAVDAPEVAAAALPHYAVTGHPGVRDAVEAALASDALPLREAAWHAMALSGHPHAATVLRKELAGEHAARAAVALAIVGDQRDAAHLLDLAVSKKARPFIIAVGWSGASAAVQPLIALLAQLPDPEEKLAVAYALERITGAGLWEKTLVDPDEIMVPDVPEPDVGEPPPARPALAPMVSDPRDLPGEGAPDVLEQPTIDARRWQAYWQEKGPNFDPQGRFRRGWPYAPLVSLRELDRWRCTPGERRLLQRELVVRTGRFVRFDPHDFVVVQEQSLQLWEPHATSASSQPGAWVTPMRRG